jgi:hypothetical protein
MRQIYQKKFDEAAFPGSFLSIILFLPDNDCHACSIKKNVIGGDKIFFRR